MKTSKLFFIAAFALGFSISLAQVVDPIDKNKIANGGYDLVSYFLDDKASQGNPAFTYELNGTKYQFVSAEHLEIFKSNYQKYLPVCDGYCAWGVAEKSKKVPVNPKTYKILNGKLHLFFNGDFGGSQFNALEDWNKNEERLAKKMPENWAKIK